MKIRLVVVLVLAGLGLLSARADENANKWLSADEEQGLAAAVPAPPTAGSAADLADLAQVVVAQTARTTETIAECRRDEKFGYRLFDGTYGATLTEERAPKLNQMLKEVLKVTRVVDETAKNKYRRPRPYQGHPDAVHALFDVTGYSYPSGHSMASYTLAVVLGAVFPDKQKALFDRAAQIAQSRVNAGVHYPSDIHEGEKLGRATGAAIVANARFQQDLAAVKSELGALR